MRNSNDEARELKARRAAWLADFARQGGPAGRAAGLLLSADSIGAIAFAAGLAYGLAALPRGLAPAAPWLALGTAGALCRGGAGLLSLRAGARSARAAKAGLRDRLTRQSLALAEGDRPATGALMAAAIDQVETLDGYLARFAPARAAVVGMLAVLVASAAASPIAAAIMGATLIPFIFIMIVAGGAAADQSAAQLRAMTRLGATFADRIRALPLILAFQAEARETAALGRAAEELARRTMAVLRIAFISSAGLEFFAALAVALVAVYAGFNLLGFMPRVLTPFGFGHLDLAQAFFVLALAPELYAPMRRLAATYHDRQAAEAVADHLMDFEARSAPPAPPPRGLSAPPAIVFERVTLRYPGEDRAAVQGFSCAVAPGEIVALLGPSGGGKTSILRLLLGLVQPSAGRVTVDGQTLAEGGGLAGQIGWMGQAPLLTPGSIAENIALADRAASPQAIAAAAAEAGLSPMLARRPGGLDSALDERGSGLSGGERQRIALARLFLKPAPLLLLDEPTAHLDAESEAAIAESIARAARGRTTLIATHSPRLAAIADRIIRLEPA